jgi:4'-phosphopantetheinyl transferase
LEKLKINATLSDLKHSRFNKPYFNQRSDFSIAHSGGLVIAAGTIKGKVGVDVEKISTLGIEDYEDQLTFREWEHINNSSDRLKAFFNIWTKKEALVKAMGFGINIDLKRLEVSDDKTKVKHKKYAFVPLSLAPNYIAHLATSASVDSEGISIVQFTAGQ